MKDCIYCLGDSNTFGFDPGSFLGEPYEKPWPKVLEALTGCPVYNDGINGRTLADVLCSYPLLKKQLQEKQPGRLILLLGSNDLLLGDFQTPQPVAEQMERLVKTLREDFKTLPILLLSPPDIRIPGPYRPLVKALGPCYQAVAERYQADFLNLSACDLPLSYDGVHFTEEGHRLLGHMLYTKLK